MHALGGGHWIDRCITTFNYIQYKYIYNIILYALLYNNMHADIMYIISLMQASLNRQIQKWFQNNEFSDRKSMGMVRQNQPKSNSVSGSTYEGDTEDENISADHIIELQREMKRPQNHWDIDKIARLLSLSYKSRMESCGTGRGSQTRIAESMTAYPCFKYPIFVSFMFHLYIIQKVHA
jgi:hypothetical protein